MLVRVLCVFLLCLVGSPVSAEGETIAEAVKAHVKTMTDATVAGKYNVVLDLTHPKALGGREAAGPKIKAAMDAIKAKGYTFQVKDIGAPTVVKGDKAHYAVAPYTTVVSGAGRKITTNTSVVGVSTDGGKAWLFVNVSAKGEDGVRKLLPDLPRDLRVSTPRNRVE